MSAARVLPYLGFVLSGLRFAAPASGQIYTWRDAQGHFILSNRHQPPARDYAVQGAETTRTTRFVSTSRSRLYDDLIAEHARLNGVRAHLFWSALSCR